MNKPTFMCRRKAIHGSCFIFLIENMTLFCIGTPTLCIFSSKNGIVLREFSSDTSTTSKDFYGLSVI